MAALKNLKNLLRQVFFRLHKNMHIYLHSRIDSLCMFA